MSRTNAKNALNPRPDLSQFRPFAERLCAIAKGHPGKFVVSSYGEDPETGAKLDPCNIHVLQGEGAERLCEAVEFLSETPGSNVYVMASLVRDDLPDDHKGEEADVVGVLAAVPDFDGSMIRPRERIGCRSVLMRKWRRAQATFSRGYSSIVPIPLLT